MKLHAVFMALVLAAQCGSTARAQDASTPENRRDFRYSLAAIDDVTMLDGLRVKAPSVENQLLLEPSFTVRFPPRWSVSSSVVGIVDTQDRTHTQLRVKEAYAGLSAGDFDFTAGRKLLRWGTGYAFTAAGVLDPPRMPTNPTDRLNLNVGRDMVKVEWIRGRHAVDAVWSTAALTPARANLHDTTAVRYNVLVRGFDTSLIAGDDRGGDAFGALTFTRVIGQAWEVHGEAAWREQGAVLIGGKYTTGSGITLIGEFYAPPNTSYFRDPSVSPAAGRQHFAFLNAGKSRLRELPGWKEWDLSASAVANMDDKSFTGFADVNRRFGNRFSTYLHLEVPGGARRSDFGSAPYSASTSAGVRFQL